MPFVKAECRAVGREVEEEGANYLVVSGNESMSKITTCIYTEIIGQEILIKGHDSSARMGIRSGRLEAMVF